MFGESKWIVPWISTHPFKRKAFRLEAWKCIIPLMSCAKINL